MQYGLIGETLGHSFSKLIHEQVESYEYQLHPLPPDRLDEFMTRRRFAAINVTIPYKRSVIPYCSWVEPQAAAIGAVNCVVNRSGLLYGYNTDAAGFAYLLSAHGIEIAGRTVLVLGSGGTHDTVCAVCRDLGAAALYTVSRSGRDGTLTYEEAARFTQAEVVVNTSPAGMYPHNGQCLLALDGLPRLTAVVDVVYNPFKTELLLRAEERGLTAVCGLEMLVAQAVYAAGLFLDAPPKVEKIPTVSAGLRRQLSNVSIIGMPGSGKTTVAGLLAGLLQKKFVDLDTEIEREAGCTIPEIFSRQGEDAFRDIESRVTAYWAAQPGCVLSTGGGVVKRPQNVRALRQNGPVLFLQRPLELLATDGRPLSAGPAERLRVMERERRPLYLAAGDAVVDNTGTPQQAAQAAAEAFYRLTEPFALSAQKNA